jgi:ABC-type nitrate/sulfonate/bicarbonate transport system substrate-binding protein
MKRLVLVCNLAYYFHCLFFASLSFAASDVRRLKIIYASFSGAYSPLWIAVEEGLGKKYGLELEAVYSGRVRPHQLLISGDAQYVVSGGTAVVTSYAVGVKDLAIIASFVNSTGTSIFAKPSITNPAALRGKLLGSGRPGAISDLLLRYMLKRKLNLDPNRDVKILPLGEASEVLPALERGVIDAGILATPARLLARKMGFRELLDSDELGIQFPYVGISTLKATVKKNPETTGKLVRAVSDAIQVFKTNKDRTIVVMKKYLRGASDEILQETYSYFSTRVQRYPYPSIEAIRTALEMLSDQYPQASSVDPNEVADLSFVREVEKSAGQR